MVPNFYKSLFYDIFDHYIRSKKLCQSQVTNLSKSMGWAGMFTSLGQHEGSWVFLLNTYLFIDTVWWWCRRSEFKFKEYRNSSVHKRVKTMHCNETVSSLNTKGNDEINGCNGLGTPGHQLDHDLVISPLFLLQPQHFWCREFQIYLLTIEFTWRQVRTGKV